MASRQIQKPTILLLAFLLVLVSNGHATAEQEIEHRHRVNLGLANTHTADDKDAFTIALSYEYRVAPLFGIGALGEYAAPNVESGVFGTPFSLYPYAGIRLIAMPGAEVTEEHTKFLFRLGIGYEFELERWSIAPEFNADLVDGDVNYVFGIALGYGF